MISCRGRGSRALLCAYGLVAWVGVALAADIPDLERGRALYENHCITCHGQSVHRRASTTAPTHAELRQIVQQWQEAEGLHWTEEDIVDVTAFLERVVYRGVRTGRR